MTSLASSISEPPNDFSQTISPFTSDLTIQKSYEPLLSEMSTSLLSEPPTLMKPPIRVSEIPVGLSVNDPP